MTYFKIIRLNAYIKQIQQADYIWRNSLLIKIQVWNGLFTKNCENRNTFSFIPHICHFSYHPSIAASEAPSLATLFSTKMRGGNSHSNISILVFQIFSKSKKTLLLYACKVIYLINKGVISPYLQEQGEILLKFNIICLHYQNPCSLRNTLLS